MLMPMNLKYIILLVCLLASVSCGREKQLNVMDFGAKGDGLSDDTRAIQDALDAARDKGIGTIFFPTGTYSLGTLLFDADNHGIASALHVYSGQTLKFEKEAVLLRGSAEVSHMVFTHNEPDATDYDGCSRVTIEGAVVDENASLGTNDTALNISHSSDVRISDCTFRGASGSWHSIEINSSRDVVVEGCLFEKNSNSEDIQIDAAIGAGNLGQSDGTVCTDITIKGNTFVCDGHVGVGNHSDAAHHDILISGNRFLGEPGKRGYISFVPLTYSVVLEDNYFQDETAIGAGR